MGSSSFDETVICAIISNRVYCGFQLLVCLYLQATIGAPSWGNLYNWCNVLYIICLRYAMSSCKAMYTMINIRLSSN